MNNIIFNTLYKLESLTTKIIMEIIYAIIGIFILVLIPAMFFYLINLI